MDSQVKLAFVLVLVALVFVSASFVGANNVDEGDVDCNALYNDMLDKEQQCEDMNDACSAAASACVEAVIRCNECLDEHSESYCDGETGGENVCGDVPGGPAYECGEINGICSVRDYVCGLYDDAWDLHHLHCALPFPIGCDGNGNAMFRA